MYIFILIGFATFLFLILDTTSQCDSLERTTICIDQFWHYCVLGDESSYH